MPNIVQIRKLADGPKQAIFYVYFKSDGSSGELVNYTLINPNTDLLPSMGVGQRLSLVKVWYGLAGVDVKLSFDGLEDQPVWIVPAGSLSGHVNFAEFGGLPDKSGIDATGKLLITTTGLQTVADQGSLVIKVFKNPAPFVNP